jgi:hypothetical protein
MDPAVDAELGVQIKMCLNTGVSIAEIPRERGCGKLLQYGNVDHLEKKLWERVELRMILLLSLLLCLVYRAYAV